MSIYSEVAITMGAEDYKTFIKEAQATGNNAIISCIKSALHFDNSDEVTIYWKAIKWNPWYEDIEFIEKFRKGVPHRFLRVGEELGDIEDYENDNDETGYGSDTGIVNYIDIPYINNEIIPPFIETDGEQDAKAQRMEGEAL